MKLKQITIEQLFGIYTYTIYLWEEEAVTILHSPNGHGKTTILKLVEAVMEGNILYLDETPFLSLSLTFNDETVVSVRKREVQEHLLEQNFMQIRKMALHCPNIEFPFWYEIQEKGKEKTGSDLPDLYRTDRWSDPGCRI